MGVVANLIIIILGQIIIHVLLIAFRYVAHQKYAWHMHTTYEFKSRDYVATMIFLETKYTPSYVLILNIFAKVGSEDDVSSKDIDERQRK